MRSFRSRPVDDHTAALARARVAYVAGRRGAVATEPAGVVPPDRPDDALETSPLRDPSAGLGSPASRPPDSPPAGRRRDGSPRRHARRARSASPDGSLDAPWQPPSGTDDVWAEEPLTPPDPAWARPGSPPLRFAHPAAAGYDDDAPEPAPSDDPPASWPRPDTPGLRSAHPAAAGYDDAAPEPAPSDDPPASWPRPDTPRLGSAHAAAAGYDDDAPEPPLSDASRLPLRFGRLGLERVQLAVIVLVVAAGAIGAAVLFLLARPEVVPVEPELVTTGTPVETTPPDATPDAAGPAATGSPDDEPDAAEDADDDAAAPIVIHVAGLVARPGVVQLPSGSRVVDAIEAAGGATPEADLTPINLARVLTDGEQVLVTADPPPAAPPAAPPAGEPSDPAPSGPVNLNTATAAELEALPGIGPTLAGRILEWRDQNGRFTSVDELREVSGIGEQRFAELEPLVTL